MRMRQLFGPIGALGAAALFMSATPATSHAAGPADGMPTVHQMGVKAAHGARPTKSSNLSYHGGIGGIGVETGAD